MMCIRCKEKPKHKTHLWCVTCRRLYDEKYYEKNKARLNARKQIRRRRNRAYLNKAKSKGCAKCGKTDIRYLDFHHIRDKVYNLSGMLGHSRERIDEEIAKCEILCNECHRDITAQEEGYWGFGYGGV